MTEKIDCPECGLKQAEYDNFECEVRCPDCGTFELKKVEEKMRTKTEIRERIEDYQAQIKVAKESNDMFSNQDARLFENLAKELKWVIDEDELDSTE